MQPEFSSICGITEEELHTIFYQDITMLATQCKCTTDDMKERLKLQYDGYHFSENQVDIYNPFSILKAFSQKKLLPIGLNRVLQLTSSTK